MGSLAPGQRRVSLAQDTHPKCPICAVPMWLVQIIRHVSDDPKLTRNRFECVVCDAVAVLPPMNVSSPQLRAENGSSLR